MRTWPLGIAFLSVIVCGVISCDKSAAGPNGAQSGNDSVVGVSPTAMRRLTSSQYKNTITAIFGETIVVPTLSITDLAVDGLTAAGSSQVGMPPTDAEGFVAAADNIARQVVDPAYRSQLPCEPQSVDDADCTKMILETYGSRLMHRPMSASQVQNFVLLAQNQASEANDFYQGVASMMTGLLLSPAFLFRVDTTVGSGPNPKAWDAYTLADRLSYLLWNSAPDASLWQAAQDNSLMRPSVYEAQVQRLLSDPRSDDALFEFFHDVLQLDGILTAQKDPNIYTPQLAQDLYTQAAMTIKDLLLTQNADYRELFVSQDFFVNANLAARYGFTPVRGNDFVKMHYTANDRAGLFGLPGITTMLSPSARTSPTKRGIYIRGALMCTPIPSPPATANTTVTADANNPRTMRQLMIEHATNPECSGCHSLMDPLGFALDDFDWLGAYRSSDQGLPLDLSGSLNGQDFVNARTFGRALHDDVFVTQCLVTKFLLHATASAPDPTSPSVLALNQAFAAQGYRIKELVREFVMSPAFTQAP